jgi:hypothetical protein
MSSRFTNSKTKEKVVRNKSVRTILHACFVLLIFPLTAGPAIAQQGQGTFDLSIPAGSGTLYYTVAVTAQSDAQCGNVLITSTYSNFSYTVSGTTTALEGSDTASWNACTGLVSNPTVSLWAPSAEIVFTPTVQEGWAGNWSGESAVTTPLGPGVLYPKYQILSLVYDPPGNLSADGYTDSTTDISTNSTESSFQYGDTVTYSLTAGTLGPGDTLSWSFGSSETTGNSAAWTESIMRAGGVSNNFNSGGSNAVNHRHDLFILWLNPSVTLYQTGPTEVTYGIGTQTQASNDVDAGRPEAVDAVEVYAVGMMANAKGNTSVPLRVLQPQVINVEVDGVKKQETLPGLAAICANQSYYPGRCAASPNQQCGCVPGDFTAILAADPLLNFTNTESPLKANTSSDPRFIDVSSTTLQGPSGQGGNRPVNSFTETDSAQTPQTWANGYSYTVGFSWEEPWVVAGNGTSLKDTTEFTWSTAESIGESNGQAHTMTVSLSSETVGCNEDVTIFEDTVYHTFTFQQPADNTTCP